VCVCAILRRCISLTINTFVTLEFKNEDIKKKFHNLVPFAERKSIVTLGDDIISYSNNPGLADSNYTALRAVSHTISKYIPLDNFLLVENQQIVCQHVKKHMEIDTGVKGFSIKPSSEEIKDTGVKGSFMDTSSEENNYTGAKDSKETSPDESNNTGAKDSSKKTSTEENAVATTMSLQWPPPSPPTKKFLKAKHGSLKKKPPFLNRISQCTAIKHVEANGKSVEWPPPMNNDSMSPKKPKSYSDAAVQRPDKLENLHRAKQNKSATSKESGRKGRTFPLKWLSYNSREIFADGSSSISNHRPHQNLKEEILRLPSTNTISRLECKSLISRKQQFKVWKNIKWKYKVSCKKRELLFKNKGSNSPFKKGKKKTLCFLVYIHRLHAITRPPHYGSTAVVAVSTFVFEAFKNL